MILKAGMLCYIVVSPGMAKTLDGKFCTIREHGHDDLCLAFNDGRPVAPWFAEWHVPFIFTAADGRQRFVRGCYVGTSILRPIGEPGKDDVDQTLEWVPSPRRDRAISENHALFYRPAHGGRAG